MFVPRRESQAATKLRVLHRGLVVGTLSMLLGPIPAMGDLLIRNYQPARHDRFYVGADKAFVGDAHDWSGVGKAGGRWATMISPSYFLSAYHARPSGSVVFFENNDPLGPSHAYQIDAGERIGGTDLYLGKLTAPLNPTHGITTYPLLTLPSQSNYEGLRCFNYGQENRVGRNVIDGFVTQTVGGSTTDSVLYDYDGNDIPSVGGDETWLVSGDSGAPSFVASGSVLGVIGVHWYHTTTDEGDPVGSGDSFAPAYLTDIETLMVGESPTVLTVVPEPGSLLLALLCGASLLPTRRPRRH